MFSYFIAYWVFSLYETTQLIINPLSLIRGMPENTLLTQDLKTKTIFIHIRNACIMFWHDSPLLISEIKTLDFMAFI